MYQIAFQGGWGAGRKCVGVRRDEHSLHTNLISITIVQCNDILIYHMYINVKCYIYGKTHHFILIQYLLIITCVVK